MVRISRNRIDLEDARVDNAVLKDYGETLVGGASGTNTGSSYEVDLSLGNVFNLVLNANCTFTFSNPHASGTHSSFTVLLKQDSAGSRTVTWPSSVKWQSGTAPTLSTASHAADVLGFTTNDGGTKWLGFVVAQNYDIAPMQFLWTWGAGNSGRLGHNNTANRSSPVQVGALTNWASVSAGGDHIAAVKTDGTLWTWGEGGNGRLGHNSTVYRSSPTQVGTLTNWTQVAAGATLHSTAVKTDGTLWAWGSGGFGRTGLNDEVSRSSPAQVGTLATWAHVSAGDFHTGAVKTDGTLWTWGYGGLLGHNDTAHRSSPAQVGTLTNWTQVAGGANHTAAVKTDGTLWTWGYGVLLGHSNTADRSSPAQVGTLTNWASVSAGGLHTGATKTDGTLWSWGLGASGQLGHNNTVALSSPTQVGTLTNWTSTSASPVQDNPHAAATRTDGTLWTWGEAGSGELDHSSTVNRSSPTQVGTLTVWASVSAGGSHTAALTSRFTPAQYTIWAWGDGDTGALDNNSQIDRSSPVQVGTIVNWESITAGVGMTAAIKLDGTLWTWGGAAFNGGQLGHNSTLNRSSPTQVGTLATWESVALGGFVSIGHVAHAAAIRTNGTLWTWGYNESGNLGLNDDEVHRSSPTQVGTLTDWASVSTSFFTDAAVKTNGTLWVWGINNSGQVGNNDTAHRSSPTQVGTLTNWASVSAGFAGTAATKTDGTLWTWGSGTYGVLGHNDAVYRSSPTQVGTLTNWASVSVGFAGTAATKTDGTLWTWGNASGHNDEIARSSPTQVGTLTDWAGASAGLAGTVAVKTDGTLWTWGGSSDGALGHGDVVYRSSPTQVGTLTNWTSASVGFGHMTGVQYTPFELL